MSVPVQSLILFQIFFKLFIALIGYEHASRKISALIHSDSPMTFPISYYNIEWTCTVVEVKLVFLSSLYEFNVKR